MLPLVPLILCVAPLAGTPEQRAPRDLEQALAALRDPSTDARARGERWLALHLAPTDFARLAEALREGDLESRRRVALALAADERHLDLAVLCAADFDPAVRAVGEWAAADLVAAWMGARDVEPVSGTELSAELAGRWVTRWSVDPRGQSLDRLLDRLERVVAAAEEPFARPAPAAGESDEDEALRGASPLPRLVLSPLLYERDVLGPRGAGDPAERRVEGSFWDLVQQAARWNGGRVEAYGARTRDGALASGAWLHVAPRGSQGRATAEELVLRWLREVVEHVDRPRGAGAARALAALDWPAALGWLERRWRDAGDLNARSGLLLAAGRGRVAPSLASGPSVRALLAAADRALTPAAPDAALAPQDLALADDVQRALGAMGSLGVDGASLADLVAERWREGSPARTWLRLAVLARWGGGSDELRAELADAVDGRQLDGRVALQALRVLAEGGGPAPLAPSRPQEWLDAADLPGAREALLDDLERLGVCPPQVWSRRSVLPDGVRPDRVVEWWLRCGRPRAAAELLAALVREGAPTTAVVERLTWIAARGDAARVREVTEALPAGLEAGGCAAGEYLAALAGALDAEAAEALLERVLGQESPDPDLLGALAARLDPERGAPARERLLALLDDALDEGPAAVRPELPPALLSGLRRALVGLQAGPAPEAAEAFRDRLLRGLERSGLVVSLFLSGDLGPPHPEPRTRALEGVDPSVGEVFAGRAR